MQSEQEEMQPYNRVSHDMPAPFSSTSAAAPTPVESGRINGETRRSSVMSYWNKENHATVIGIIDEHSFIRECIASFLQEVGDMLEVTSFASCEDFIKNSTCYDVILYHAHQTMSSNSQGNQKFAYVKPLTQIAPVIILSAVECRVSMIEAFESGARGFILTTNTTPKQVIEIIRLVKAGGTFVPSSLSLQRSNGSGLSPALTAHQFTPRELAILEHLRLGKANKIIAHELQMSESTVKVHIKSIMTKLKVTNRTEVVSRAYGLGDIGALLRHEI